MVRFDKRIGARNRFFYISITSSSKCCRPCIIGILEFLLVVRWIVIGRSCSIIIEYVLSLDGDCLLNIHAAYSVMGYYKFCSLSRCHGHSGSSCNPVILQWIRRSSDNIGIACSLISIEEVCFRFCISNGHVLSSPGISIPGEVTPFGRIRC